MLFSVSSVESHMPVCTSALSGSDFPVCSGNRDSEMFCMHAFNRLWSNKLKRIRIDSAYTFNHLNPLKFKILVSSVFLGRELLLLIDFLFFPLWSMNVKLNLI